MSRKPPQSGGDDAPLPPHGMPPELENRRPCLRCNTPTLVSTLNHYGARCFSCYEAYCREPMLALGKQVRQPRRQLWDGPAGEQE